jgi:hypothetical protein
MPYPQARLTKVGKLMIGTETTFASLTAPATVYLRCDPVDLSGLTQEGIENTYQRAKNTQVPRIMGAKGGAVSLKTLLSGWSASVPVSDPSNLTHPMLELFAWAFGTKVEGGYLTGTFTGSSTTKLKATDLSALKAGQAIAYMDANGKYEVLWLTENDATTTPDEATFLQAANAAITEYTPTVYGSVTFATVDGLGRYSEGVREGFHLQHMLPTAESMYMYGCIPASLKLTLERGKPGMVEMSMSVAHWKQETGGDTLIPSTWIWPEPEAILGAWVTWGTDMATKRAVGKVEFDLKLEVVPIPDTNAIGGIGGWFIKSRKPTCTFTVVRDIDTECTEWASQTGKPFSFTFGSQPGKMFSLLFPCARISEYPAPADEEGKMMSKISIEAQEMATDTDDSGGLANTDCRFAFL